MFFEIGLPGLVFLGLAVWLIRKAARAARTEGDLEGNRLQGALADELQAARARAAAASEARTEVPSPPSDPYITAPDLHPGPFPGDPLSGADLRDARPEHLPLLRTLISERTSQIRVQHPERRVQVLWVHSNDTHCAWCERRHAGTPNARPRDVICVAAIDRGKITERWSFG